MPPPTPASAPARLNRVSSARGARICNGLGRTAIGYIRVSTARQGRSALGLEVQQAALVKFCDAEAFKLVETYTETESGADDDRPQLSAAISPMR
jgi:hypothetical protein